MVPVGVVLMTIGLIVAGTAVIIWLLLSQQAITLSPRLEAAVIPTAVPTEEVGSEEPIALLPETPLEPAYPAHFVSALDYEMKPVPGQPKRIVIPTLDLDAPVSSIGLAPVEANGQTYYQWQVPAAFEAGWHNTSAPLGQVGNTVLNGHHNIFGEVFGHLADLEEGDLITVYDTEDTAYTYTVEAVEILPERGQPLEVRQANAEWILPTDDERLTLVTCWPHDDNSHRLIVVGPTSRRKSNTVTHYL